MWRLEPRARGIPRERVQLMEGSSYVAQADIEIRRKLMAILRVLQEADGPLGAARIAQELARHGITQSERMVRLYLDRLDAAGLTRNLGRSGRAITRRGAEELSTELAIDKVGFVAARADTLAYQMTLDLATGRGTLVVNVSLVPLASLRAALTVLEEAFDWGLGVGRLVAFAEEGRTFAGREVPSGHVAIATVCSMTINGLLLKAGIPVTSVFGGLVEIDHGTPIRFAQIIRYDGTTIDPLEIFIQGAMTRVRRAIRSGRGIIGAGFREIPSSARPRLLELRDKLEAADLGAMLLVGVPNQPVMDFPVSFGRTGIVLAAGLNPIAAIHEQGIPTRNSAMGALIDRSELVHYKYLRQHFRGV